MPEGYAVPGTQTTTFDSISLPDTPFSLISNLANKINGLLYRFELSLDSEEKQIIVKQLVQLMERRIQEADASDFSRLAWLALRLRDEARAKKYTELGLKKDPNNEYCLKLVEKLKIVV